MPSPCDNCRFLREEQAEQFLMKRSCAQQAPDGVFLSDWGCRFYVPLPKHLPHPFCGGPLSEIRRDINGREYRHCYGCHFDYYLEDDRK